MGGLAAVTVLTLVSCTLQPDDTVKSSLSATGEGGILVYGWQNGTYEYGKPFSGTLGAPMHVGNFTQSKNGSLPDGIVFFASSFAPTMAPDAVKKTNPVVWSDGPDDVAVTLEPEYGIPAHVWILTGPRRQYKRAADAIVRTTLIWQNEHQGLTFSPPAVINDVRGKKDATGKRLKQIYSDRQLTCDDINQHLVPNGFVKADALNIYYGALIATTDTVTSGGGSAGSYSAGYACPDGDDYVAIIMGEETGKDLLSHEITHLLSLEHVDGLSDFDRVNVMHSASVWRKALTEGQTFRAIFNPQSVLNKLLKPVTRGTATTLSAYCDGVFEPKRDQYCPALQKRLWADEGENGRIWPAN